MTARSACGIANGAGENGVEQDAPLRVRACVNVSLGDGDDTLNIHGVSARLGATVHAGDGNDTVDARHSRLLGLSVLGDDGEDHVIADDLHARFFSVFAATETTRSKSLTLHSWPSPPC